jgi:hypothetical protein
MTIVFTLQAGGAYFLCIHEEEVEFDFEESIAHFDCPKMKISEFR